MKINIGPKAKDSPQDLDYLYENYRPAKSGGPANFYKSGGREHKWIFQLLASGAILLVILGLFKANIPFTGALKNGVKYLLTSETDFRPAFHQVVELAAQVGNVELPVADDVPSSTKTAITEVPPGTLLLLPVSGNVINTYGWLVDPRENLQKFHEGVDIAAPVGTGVKASADGKVIDIGENSGLGKYVLVKNLTGELVRYANLSEVLVQKEQQLKAGNIIAKTGVLGDSEPHLHFEVIVNGRPVDPLSRLGVDFTRTDGTNRSDGK
ncbi:MAG: M23 family metallopeptidase [Eubacteriales bacterium]